MFSLLGFTLAWSPTNAPPSAKIIFVFLNLISVSLYINYTPVCVSMCSSAKIFSASFAAISSRSAVVFKISSSVVFAFIIHILKVFLPLSTVVTIYANPLSIIFFDILSVNLSIFSGDNPSGSYLKFSVPQQGLEMIFQFGRFSSSFLTRFAL